VRIVFKALVVVLLVITVVAAATLAYVRTTGLRADAVPGTTEARIARAVRMLATPSERRNRANPLPASAEVITAGLEHFADHCSSCHGNDGSGDTQYGRGLYPRPLDLRAEGTQQRTDGELFYLIEHGIRFTGMPAFGTGQKDGEEASWQLVHFIRHLPRLTETELERMQELNPRSMDDVRQQLEEERFLRGD
jgi:mono/diheme cytochrome c family protein